MKPCSICTHPSADDIEAALDCGSNQKDIAAQFDISKFALSRHVRHSKPVGKHDSLAEVSRWLTRANDQYLLATANEDARGAVAALVAGLRAVESNIRNEERAEEAKLEPVIDRKITIAQIDKLLADADEQSLGRAKSESLRLKMPSCYELFLAMHSNSSLRTAVLQFAKDYEAKTNESVSQQIVAVN
jgi:hypothetical protein